MERGVETTITRNDHDRISPTAKITAYWRSLSDIPYSKEIAEAVQAEETAKELVGERILTMGKLSPLIFEVRYKAINSGLNRSGISNVMELAGGLSPRGLEIAADGGFYVGTDLPEMHSESSPVIVSIARRTGVPLDKLHLQPANVLKKAEMEDAAAHFAGKRFAVCNEGLLMYLDIREKAEMARNIHDLLLPAGGKWITTDIVFREIRQKIFAMLGPEAKKVAEPSMKNISEHTGRDVFANNFSSKAEAVDFYGELGFDIEEYPMYSGEYPLSTAAMLPESLREEYLGIFSSAKAWILAPRG